MLIIPAVKHIRRRSQRGSLPVTSCLAARPKSYSSIHFSEFPYLPCKSGTFQQQYSSSSGKLREHLTALNYISMKLELWLETAGRGKRQSYFSDSIIIIIIISFMQGIYTYIPETNHVPREYSVSAILSLLFMVSISLVATLALLYFYVSTFRSTWCSQ